MEQDGRLGGPFGNFGGPPPNYYGGGLMQQRQPEADNGGLGAAL